MLSFFYVVMSYVVEKIHEASLLCIYMKIYFNKGNFK